VATLEELLHKERHPSRNLRSIVDRVRPAVQPLLDGYPGEPDLDELVRRGVRANVRASTGHLRHGSEVLEQLMAERKLMIVGAEYSLETGEVEFFEGLPP
jgi:carbonic anhydrase